MAKELRKFVCSVVKVLNPVNFGELDAIAIYEWIGLAMFRSKSHGAPIMPYRNGVSNHSPPFVHS